MDINIRMGNNGVLWLARRQHQEKLSFCELFSKKFVLPTHAIGLFNIRDARSGNSQAIMNVKIA